MEGGGCPCTYSDFPVFAVLFARIRLLTYSTRFFLVLFTYSSGDPTGHSPLAGGSGNGCPLRFESVCSRVPLDSSSYHSPTAVGIQWGTAPWQGARGTAVPFVRIRLLPCSTRFFPLTIHPQQWGSNGAQPLGRGLGGRPSPEVKTEDGGLEPQARMSSSCSRDRGHPTGDVIFLIGEARGFRSRRLQVESLVCSHCTMAPVLHVRFTWESNPTPLP